MTYSEDRCFGWLCFAITLLGLMSQSYWGSIVAFAQNDESVYLRYQGVLDEFSGDLPDTIECLFDLQTADDPSIWDERHNNVYIIERHFTVALGADDPITSTLFTEPLSLRVRCDIDRDGNYDVDVTEEVGLSPRAAVALSTQGPVKADYVEVNGQQVINQGGQWVGSVPDPTMRDHAANKSYVDEQINNSSQVTTLLSEQVSTLQNTLSGDINTLRRDTTEQINSLRTELSTQISDAEARVSQALDSSFPQVFSYRSRLFETYNEVSSTYFFADNSDLFGGVPPSSWSTGATANQVDLTRLNGFLIDEAQGGTNALLSMTPFTQTSDQQGTFMITHFQVDNTTDSDISWPLSFSYSCYEGRQNAPQRSSLALNGELIWSTLNSSCNTHSQSTQVNLNIPAQAEISDIVLVVAGSTPFERAVEPDSTTPVQHRRVIFAFTNECLRLPEGLRYRRTW